MDTRRKAQGQITILQWFLIEVASWHNIERTSAFRQIWMFFFVQMTFYDSTFANAFLMTPLNWRWWSAIKRSGLLEFQAEIKSYFHYKPTLFPIFSRRIYNLLIGSGTTRHWAHFLYHVFTFTQKYRGLINSLCFCFVSTHKVAFSHT